MKLLASRQLVTIDRERLLSAARENTVAGLPVVVLSDGYLPDDVLGIFFSGSELFDPTHPERTVVLRKGTA